MAISVTNLGASTPAGIVAPDFESSADATSYANASWTPPSADNCIILLWVYNTKATDVGVAGSVSGNGLTWTLQASNAVDPGAQTHRLTLYAAISTGTATAGQTTVSFAGVTQSGIIMMFQQVEGVDLTGALAGVIIQQPSNTSSSANSLAANLSAASDPANRFFAGVGHGQVEGANAEAGWNELDDWGGASPGRALLVMWDADSVADTSPTVSWTTAGAAVAISCEVVAAPAVGGSTFEEAVTIAKDVAIAPANTMTMSMAVTLAAVRALTDATLVNMFPNMTLSKVNTVSFATQQILNAVIAVARVEGITPSSIATLNAAFSVDKDVAIIMVGDFPAIVTKGYVSILDFSTNPVTVTSFKANSTDTSDFDQSGVEAGDF
jgi:hypothetical protein